MMTRKKNVTETVTPAAQRSPWRHLPNILSLSRLALVPLIFWLSLSGANFLALLVFLLGPITDLLDGYLARRFGWESDFGSRVDPIADRVFVLCLMPLLWYYGAIAPLYAALVVMRYAIQLSVIPVLRLWLKKPFRVAPDWISKLAALVVFVVLGMGFADQVAIELFPDTSSEEVLFQRSMTALAVTGTLLEIWILCRFVPRYRQIVRGTHDTFE
ncbi:CDP-alcohol phosphatidyltransferase family protein [Microbulbifer bruguierae]|uniref:CDP-diacylglycerol--glycerol-3-phosphate 3-phosphatidyltransferase n=1 Tax=Microbulbifer bruguierae TaxID=3029061 RepID=A0ABY8N8W7_9GAMM|nr:CDP-alcohol phosphatidyltransferase family protein [Microbulbifer bruguierae]WGL15344.1 CDP-alcohol phosphatidyltransferase family protein [Microbulbifer bruguierae]